MDVTARLNPLYKRVDSRMQSRNHGKIDTCSVESIVSHEQVPVGYDKYLTFTQAEKTTMLSAGFDTSTVHEFQGKQASRIAVVRLNATANVDIFNKTAYALVALSRHTDKLVYYTTTKVTDALRRRI